jgi:rSAM/selenodomain-associated transferase 1
MRATRIVIFAKAPVPGSVKTRLIPALGEAGAAQLAFEMLQATVGEACAAGLGMPELCATPRSEHASWQPFLPGAQVSLADQGEGNLGVRLARAASRVVEAGENILLIGTDCPALGSHRLRSAASALATNDAVIHATVDGGYALLGLRRFDPSLFQEIAWSGPTVAADTIRRIEALGWSLAVRETLRDIDEPEDLTAVGELQCPACS